MPLQLTSHGWEGFWALTIHKNMPLPRVSRVYYYNFSFSMLPASFAVSNVLETTASYAPLPSSISFNTATQSSTALACRHNEKGKKVVEGYEPGTRGKTETK
jgi:hypothetical protein